MNKTIIIMGSSRSDGNTRAVIREFDPQGECSFVDLNDLNITPYDYDHENLDDDYIPLMEKIFEYDCIILASPVYWYSMSATMKTFFDRLCDITTTKKHMGRKLAGKKLAVLASSVGNDKGFDLPFSQTADYLNMDYRGCFFHYSGDDKILLAKNAELSEFKNNILA